MYLCFVVCDVVINYSFELISILNKNVIFVKGGRCNDMNPRLNDISCMETKEPANSGGTLNKLHESIRII